MINPDLWLAAYAAEGCFAMLVHGAHFFALVLVACALFEPGAVAVLAHLVWVGWYRSYISSYHKRAAIIERYFIISAQNMLARRRGVWHVRRRFCLYDLHAAVAQW